MVRFVWFSHCRGCTAETGSPLTTWTTTTTEKLRRQAREITRVDRDHTGATKGTDFHVPNSQQFSVSETKIDVVT